MRSVERLHTIPPFEIIFMLGEIKIHAASELITNF